jgi:catechol 2,3-dioxygenase-like lactoylglutathione lyase family enzyme
MKSITVLVFSIFVVLGTPAPVSAQLNKNGPIVYGHHHLMAASVDAHKKFWVDTLGGTYIKIEPPAGLKPIPLEIIKFEGVFVLLTARAPGGGSKGTTANHLGFQVSNLRAMVDKVKAAGYPLVTRAELPSTYQVKDDIAFAPDQNTSVAFVMAPDDVKVEFFENKAWTKGVALHHVHFATPQVAEMQAWYAKVFGAKAGKRGSFEAADLPGVNLTFSAAAEPVVPTQGRAIDHIGFEVKDLENFCKQLESMGIKLNRGYTPVPALGLHVAFITDPWGTYIELTQGLDKW